jgi:acetyl esterase/lipase
MALSACLFPLAPGVRRSAGFLGGVPSDVFVGATDEGLPILHLHGGAFFTGSRRTRAALASELCACSGATVHLLDHRLAPEHPWPAAPSDVLQAWQALRDQVWPQTRSWSAAIRPVVHWPWAWCNTCETRANLAERPC